MGNTWDDIVRGNSGGGPRACQERPAGTRRPHARNDAARWRNRHRAVAIVPVRW